MNSSLNNFLLFFSDFHQPPIQQPVFENPTPSGYFQPDVPNANMIQQNPGHYQEAFSPTPFQQMPPLAGVSQSNQYMTQPVNPSATELYSSNLPPGQHGLQPGMQYMDMPFDGQVPISSPSSHESLPGGISRPMQVVPPQPQVSGPQLYSPSGHLIPTVSFTYYPVQAHWFYLKDGVMWYPFSFVDSRKLEAALLAKEQTVVATNGGRFDVNLGDMTRKPVYWKGKKSDVRRSTWFYRGESEVKLIPYDQHVSELLEV